MAVLNRFGLEMKLKIHGRTGQGRGGVGACGRLYLGVSAAPRGCYGVSNSLTSNWSAILKLCY